MKEGGGGGVRERMKEEGRDAGEDERRSGGMQERMKEDYSLFSCLE